MGSQADASVPALSRETLRQCVIAGAERVIAHREHLNKINVFPVPDRDTGTNLAVTMRAVIAGLQKPLPSLDAVGKTLAASALAGAQGNSGVILAQYFQGLREGIGDGAHVTVDRFVAAMRHAALRARQALAQPREGTILTVMSDVAEHLVSCCKERADDFRTLLDEGLRAARQSLAQTTDRLAVLRHAGVVDAGALGFVHFLEGIRDHLFHEVQSDESEEFSDEVGEVALDAVSVDEPLDFRYCTEAIVQGAKLDPNDLIERLSELGDSVVVAGEETSFHTHVHTNVPALVLEELAERGTVSSLKTDDMWTNLPPSNPGAARAGTALVTDSVCDLPIEYLTKRRIHVVPFRLAFGDDIAVDGVDITPRLFYSQLESSPSLPTTSQPSPADFEMSYRVLARRFADVVSVHLSSDVSGTTSSAQRAAERISRETGMAIHVVDCRTASAGEACVVWAAARAIEGGLDAAASARVAREVAEATSVYVFVPTVKYFILGGRLSPLQGRVAQLLHLLPVLTVRNGRVEPKAKVFGRRAAVSRVLRLALRDASSSRSPLFVISHSEAPMLARRLEKELRRRHPLSEILLAPAGSALGTHSGPGGAAVATLDADLVDRAIARESLS